MGLILYVKVRLWSGAELAGALVREMLVGNKGLSRSTLMQPESKLKHVLFQNTYQRKREIPTDLKMQRLLHGTNKNCCKY